jgi:lipopolysaccharide cholinephosphotransferase
MEKLTDNEIKESLVNLLKEFDSICKKYNLRYSLDAGTLIGAVRHKGFIPWDDDIDVTMPREDYEKLLSLQYQDDNFEIKSYRYTKDYYYIFSKIIDKRTLLIEDSRAEKNMGIYVDIFPQDFFDDIEDFNKGCAKKLRTKAFIDHLGANTSYKESKNIFRFIAKNIVHLFLNPFRIKIINHIENRSKSSKGKYCINLVYDSNTNDKAVSKAEIWNNLEYLDFENIKVLGFKDYDRYLRARYGEYMEFPPIEQQVGHHNYVAYRK